MTESVLLTGISGFLGGHTALQLLKSGYKVRGSVRNLDRADKVRQTLAEHGADVSQLEFVALDLMYDRGWDDAMAGVRYLQHTASPFVTSMPEDKMELIGPAVEGTTRAINAALKAKIERIVLTSSMAAIAYGHPASRTAPFTEEDWTNIDGPGVNAYVESKTLAEQKAWELMEKARRRSDLAVINPSLIAGPLLDEDPGTSGVILKRFLDGSIPGAPRFFFPIVDVRDVAQTHLKAMQTSEAGGSRFATSTDGLWMIEIAREIKRAFPQFKGKVPKFEMPDWAVRLYALFDRDVRGNLAALGHQPQLDNSKARALLGRDFISNKEAISAMVKSLVDKGLV